LFDCQAKPHNLALAKAQIDREMDVRKHELASFCLLLYYLILY